MRALLGLCDLAVMAAAAAAACWLAERDDAFRRPMLTLGAILTLLIFSRCDLYSPRRTAAIIWEWVDVTRACVIVAVLAGLVLSLLLPDVPVVIALFLVIWVPLAVLFRTAARMILRRARRRGWNARSAAIVGDAASADQLMQELQSSTWTGINVIYRLADEHPAIGSIDQLGSCLAREPVEMVFVALSSAQQQRLQAVLAELQKVTTDIHIVPDLVQYSFLRRQVNQIGSVPTISLTHSPQEGFHELLKRGMDVIGSLIGLLLFGPAMIVIAAMIRLKDGPGVLFVQRRSSLGGREFPMLKFRTMAGAAGAENDADDRRVTALGKTLRRWSLDELPQLLNVLIGQMSLVGPRPERPERIAELAPQISDYLLRQHVKSGMTGWAQIHGLRGPCDMSRRVQYDLYYIIHWSIGLDLWVLALTLLKGFFHSDE